MEDQYRIAREEAFMEALAPQHDVEPTLPPSVVASERQDFIGYLLNGDVEAACRLLDRVANSGVGEERLLTEMVAWSARSLGQGWEDDTIAFADVTIALCGLSRVLRKRDWGVEKAPGPAANAPSILLTTFAGEQHGFGVTFLEIFFQRAGWATCSMPCADSADVKAALARYRYDVLALSASVDIAADRLSNQIKVLRHASQNPGMRVLVGGPAIQDALPHGADGTADDAQSAVAEAARLHRTSKDCRTNG
ncbi:MAG: hypothetical protein AAF830_15830 [Pseudomonadota bacterium]